MTHRETDSQGSSTWECIDSAVGAFMWELELPETLADRTRQLQAHLELCDACRLDQALAAQVEAGLTKGNLVLPVADNVIRRSRTWWQRPVVPGSVGSALVAACLALLMFMAPESASDLVHLRSGMEDAAFVRPVEGEVVNPGGSVLSWKPVAGATGYKVTLSGLEQDFTWEASTADTELSLPKLNPESAGRTFRAALATVPADLVTPGSISVSFSTGSSAQVVQDRLVKAPIWLVLLGSIGLFLLGLALVSGRRSEAG